MKNISLIILLTLLAFHAFGHVKLISPTGNETFITGDTIDIKWEVVIAHGANNWDLLYSKNGGLDWETIQLDLNEKTLLYQWTIPNDITEKARIKVIQDNAGEDYDAESGDFIIQAPQKENNQLLIPPTLSGNEINLILQKGTHEFFKGIKTNTLGVNGNVLGPTLILDKGQYVKINVDNQIGEHSTIHWHGMHVSALNDGGPHTVIKAGNSWHPEFEVLDNASTYWYHPHLHLKTNDHVLRGLAGFIIVRDQEEANLDLPRDYGVDDIPIVIQTKTFDQDKNIVLGNNNLDSVVLANATQNAYVDVPAQLIRLRLLNGSSQRMYNIGFSNDQMFYQIGSDGGLLNKPVELNRLWLSPGERAEILVDLKLLENTNVTMKSYASELPQGYYGAERVGMNSMMSIPNYDLNPLNGSDFDILQLNIGSTTGKFDTIPKSLVNLNPWDEQDVDEIRGLEFAPKGFSPRNMVNGPFVINGESFDINKINYTIPLNNIEIWELSNRTMVGHPFHIHDVQFYILSRNGIPVPENERGRKDVVMVPPMSGTVRFITKFEDFADEDIPYMYHCHMLTHEDEGMMGQFVVVDNTTDYDESTRNNIDIFPNPTSDILMLRGVGSGIIELFNSSGIKLLERSKKRDTEIINLSDFKPGLFFIHIKSDLSRRTFKVIKN